MNTGMDDSTDLPFPACPGSPNPNSPNTSITKMGSGVISNRCRAKRSWTQRQVPKQHVLVPFPHPVCYALLLAGSFPGFHYMPHTLPSPATSHLRPPPLSVAVIPKPHRACASQAYQDTDGLVQGTAGFQALLALFHSVFPLQAHLNEHLVFGFFALGIQDEAPRGLILNSWRRKEIFSISFPLVTHFGVLE